MWGTYEVKSRMNFECRLSRPRFNGSVTLWCVSVLRAAGKHTNTSYALWFLLINRHWWKPHSAHVWVRCAGPTALPVFCHVACFVIHLQTLIWNRSDIDDHKRICEFYSKVVRWICVRKQPHVMMGLDIGPEGRRKIALLYFAEKTLKLLTSSFIWTLHTINQNENSHAVKKYSVKNINECQELFHKGVLSNF